MQPEDVKRIVLHEHRLLLDHHSVNSEMIRSYLIVIESCRPLLPPASFGCGSLSASGACCVKCIILHITHLPGSKSVFLWLTCVMA